MIVDTRVIFRIDFLKLKKELADLKNLMYLLCDAIESCILPNDVTNERSQNIQARRKKFASKGKTSECVEGTLML